MAVDQSSFDPHQRAPAGEADDLKELPEIAAGALNAAWLRETLAKAPAAIVRNFIPAEDVVSLSRGVGRAFAAYGDPASDPNWHRPFAHQESIANARAWVRRNGGVLAVDCPPMLRRLRDIYRRAGVVAMLTDYLGETPVLSSAKTTLRLNRPKTTGVEWHQDGAFLGADARVLNIWLALTPCGIDAASLDIALRRKTSVVGAGEDGAPHEWSISDARAMRESGSFVTPVLEAGDAVMFDHLCLHRTAKMEATKTRKAIEAWFFVASTLPANYDAVPV
jgi:hypothetical protein